MMFFAAQRINPALPIKLVLPIILCLALLLGCVERQEDAEPPAPEQTLGEPLRVCPSRALIIVPPEVEGQWQAVSIAIYDRDTGREEVYTAQIGEEFSFGDNGLSLEVRTFIPHFIMNGLVMTSASNRAENPGTQIAIRDRGEEIYCGWLFSLYPEAHAYEHPRYVFNLVDFFPSEESDLN
ncbi:DUF2155 domain-containing protein [Geoalkalibacter halelectricus]|uniref:DUF2155 domain-containing protein n=1 Tax=Geoalkalibacter halelectricus TaxID=2847045 RepID=UPI00266FF7B4|nr:DUF2155 domain-containing protein [Geoalkalibacter halelectricus]MDO3378118.1 DUF2155 domain-containing protein [Geoalkalibacter halelectricus]